MIKLLILVFFFNHSDCAILHDPLVEPSFPVIQNQGFISEINRTYFRFPNRAKNTINSRVWFLSRNSAGLAIYFRTNSNFIKISYQCLNNFSKFNIPATGVSGIDLLSRTQSNDWVSVKSTYLFEPSIQKVTYTYNETRKSDNNKGFEYRLYLPLYNTVDQLKIHTNDDSFFSWIEKDYSIPIVIYGTSIVQGCCISRPIHSWSNLVQRHFNIPILNFGFSNSARLEEEVVKLVIENEAKLYILDCLPNCYEFDVDTIKNLVFNAIKLIRNKWPLTPILLTEFCGLNYQDIDDESNRQVLNANLAQYEIYEKLIKEGEKRLFYLSKDEIGFNSNCWSDFIHPNNIGMQKYANAYIKKFNQIFCLSGSKMLSISIDFNTDIDFFESLPFLYILIMLLFKFI